VRITRRNKPVAMLLSWEASQSLIETIEILSDQEAMALFQEDVADIKAGRTVPLSEVRRRF